MQIAMTKKLFYQAVLFLLGYVMYTEVMRENVWLSRTVEVQDNQQVVDTGLYGIVRHPMYSATLILFLTHRTCGAQHHQLRLQG